MKKLVSLVLCAVLLSGCFASAEKSEGLTVTDMIGRQTVVFPGEYKRVVCIGAGALRMYSYIGDVSLLCGVEDIDNVSLPQRPKMFDTTARPYVLAYGDVFETLPSCGVGGPNAQTAEAEKILSCAPDIIISEYEDVEKADALQEQTGVPVITLRTGPDGVFSEAFSGSMRLLGTVFDRSGRAEKLIAFVENETAEIASRTSDIADEDKPSVYICGLGNWGTTDHLSTAPNYKAFEIASIKNVCADIKAGGVTPIEEEKFTELGESMDIMMIDAAALKNIKPLYAADSTMFDTCRAWREGEVYLQLAYNAYYTNFETALANAWFAAKTVYPERFSDIDMSEKTDEITEMFLGKPLGDKISACPDCVGAYRKINTDAF